MDLPRALATLAIASLLFACGEEDTLEAFTVTLTPTFDCERAGLQGAVNCVDEDVLRAVSVEGRWLFDYRGTDTFILLTEDGRSLPGVYFANDGRLQTNTCTGDGGVCHFARVRSSESDPATGCLRQEQRLVDLTVVDGALSGELFEETFTAEGCASPFIRQVRVELSGSVAAEKVAAREEYAP